MSKYKTLGNEKHTIFVDIVPLKKEQYNEKKGTYSRLSLGRFSQFMFRLDGYLKKRKQLDDFFKNRILFLKRPKYKITPRHKLYRLYVSDFHSHETSLHHLIQELKGAGSKDKLELIISSNGGSIEEGRKLYNVMQDKFYDRVVAYLDNHGYSMGAVLFCMAPKRVVYPYSNLMFHNYKGGAMGKGGEMVAKVEYFDKLNTKFRHDIVVKQGFLTEDEYKNLLIGQDFWMGTEEMCQRGIATHVKVKGKEITAEAYLEQLKELKR